MRSAPVDLYAVLGVSRAATLAELRRAYRRLALSHHPDRAGPASTQRFAQIAEAYQLLSNPVARAAYDLHTLERGSWPAQASGRDPSDDPASASSDAVRWSVSTMGWAASWPKRIPDLLPRPSGPLERLVATGVARVDPSGVLELRLTVAEAASGGTAVVVMPLRILCPTCGGVARPRGVWCRRCEFEGHVTDEVPIHIRIPPAAREGVMASTVAGKPGAAPPRVRLRVGG